LWRLRKFKHLIRKRTGENDKQIDIERKEKTKGSRETVRVDGKIWIKNLNVKKQWFNVSK
jgi:hypothetical protein